MKSFKLPLVFSLLLSACATTQAPLVMTPATTPPMTPSAATLIAPASPAPLVMPDLTSAQQACNALNAQFQTQLPFRVLNLIRWQVTGVQDPLQPNAGLIPACVLTMHTDGATIQRQGLTPDFIHATLERLDWMPGPINYNADSPIGHQEAMINVNQLAVIHYTFAPPPKACAATQPLANCKFSKKKWRYDMQTVIFIQAASTPTPALAAAPPQTK